MKRASKLFTPKNTIKSELHTIPLKVTKIYSVITGLILIVLTSCINEDLNIDPNRPTFVPTTSLIVIAEQTVPNHATKHFRFEDYPLIFFLQLQSTMLHPASLGQRAPPEA